MKIWRNLEESFRKLWRKFIISIWSKYFKFLLRYLRKFQRYRCRKFTTNIWKKFWINFMEIWRKLKNILEKFEEKLRKIRKNLPLVQYFFTSLLLLLQICQKRLSHMVLKYIYCTYLHSVMWRTFRSNIGPEAVI